MPTRFGVVARSSLGSTDFGISDRRRLLYA